MITQITVIQNFLDTQYKTQYLKKKELSSL
jgi:hypothetical protein